MTISLKDLLERAGATAVQVFLATWMALVEVGAGYDKVALISCGMAAAISVAKIVATSKLNITGSNTALKVLERTVWTGLAAFAGVWLGLNVDGDGWNPNIVFPAARNAFALAAVKGVLSLNWGDKSEPAVV
jgi:hypothetical protein